jgi:hypothetical protein
MQPFNLSCSHGRSHSSHCLNLNIIFFVKILKTKKFQFLNLHQYCLNSENCDIQVHMSENYNK